MSQKRNDIPNVEYRQNKGYKLGIEIVSLEKIHKYKDRYDPNPELPHQLQFYNFIFFTSGEGRHFVDFTWHHIDQPTFLYMAKGQVMAFDFSGTLQGYCVIFTEAYYLSCYAQCPEGFHSKMLTPQLFSPLNHLSKESDFSHYFDKLSHELTQEESPQQDAIVRSLFVILIAKVEASNHSHKSDLLEGEKFQQFQQFYALLQEGYTQSRSAAHYANELAITYKHLNEICKSVQRKTAKEIIDDFVLLKAKRMLVNSEVKSNALAYELGFEDPTNFTKYFKNLTGFTPKSFKKSLNS